MKMTPANLVAGILRRKKDVKVDRIALLSDDDLIERGIREPQVDARRSLRRLRVGGRILDQTT